MFPLLSSKTNFFTIHNDHVIAGIHVRCIRGAMLAHQDGSDFGGEPSDDLIGGIDQMPFLLDLSGLGHIGFHRAGGSHLVVTGNPPIY